MVASDDGDAAGCGCGILVIAMPRYLGSVTWGASVNGVIPKRG